MIVKLKSYFQIAKSSIKARFEKKNSLLIIISNLRNFL